MFQNISLPLVLIIRGKIARKPKKTIAAASWSLHGFHTCWLSQAVSPTLNIYDGITKKSLVVRFQNSEWFERGRKVSHSFLNQTRKMWQKSATTEEVLKVLSWIINYGVIVLFSNCHSKSNVLDLFSEVKKIWKHPFIYHDLVCVHTQHPSIYSRY